MYFITNNLLKYSQDVDSDTLTLAFVLEMLQPQVQKEQRNNLPRISEDF